MKNGQLENAGMEIRELLQSFCAEPLPECLNSIKIFQNSSNVYVRYYWKHKTPLGEVFESETVASLSDFLDEDGSPIFSLGASIVKNALIYCSDPYVQDSISERIFPIYPKDIVEFEKTLIDDKNILVKLLSVNKMLTAESQLIIHFYLENKTDSDIRVWLKSIKAIYDLNKALCDCYDIGDGPYSIICELSKNEHKTCSTVLVDEGFCNCDPFADIAAGKSENCLSFNIAYDFGTDDDCDVTPPLCFDNYMNECWFEDNQGTGTTPPPPPNPPDPVLNYNDIVIKANDFQLAAKYDIQQIHVWIKILRDDGKLLQKKVPGGYCSEKNLFFILESDFNDLSKLGVLMCRIVPRKMFEQAINGETIDGLNPESLLHQYGYTVNKKDDLTAIQRQSILTTVINEKAYTPTRLLGFLDWLIGNNTYNLKMADAVDKWQVDRDYVHEYTLSLGLPEARENPAKEIDRELRKLIEDLERICKNN